MNAATKFTDYKVADMAQAAFGRKEIAIAETEMPGLMAIREEFKGKQPLSVFSIKSSLHAFLVSWHSFFRPGKTPSKEHLGFKAPVVIKKMLTSSEKVISFKSDEQSVYLVFGDPAGKSSEEKT